MFSRLPQDLCLLVGSYLPSFEDELNLLSADINACTTSEKSFHRWRYQIWRRRLKSNLAFGSHINMKNMKLHETQWIKYFFKASFPTMDHFDVLPWILPSILKAWRTFLKWNQWVSDKNFVVRPDWYLSMINFIDSCQAFTNNEMIMMMSILLHELNHDPFKYDLIKKYILSVMTNDKNYTSLSLIRKPEFYLVSSLENKNVPMKYIYQFDIDHINRQFYSFQLEPFSMYLADYYQLYAEIIQLWVSKWRLKYALLDKINQYIVQMKWYHPTDLDASIICGFLQPLLNDQIYISDINTHHELSNSLACCKEAQKYYQPKVAEKYGSIYLHPCYGSMDLV